jgi:hypothetical protein
VGCSDGTLTSILQILEATLHACLTTYVQEYWSSRLVVRGIENISLLERVRSVWLIAVGLRKVIDLRYVNGGIKT